MSISANNDALPQGYQLQVYRIESVLERMSSSITYLAKEADTLVTIKEYLPSKLAVRQDDDTVQPKSQQEADDFTWGLEQFIQEARTLKPLVHPNLVRLKDFFRANNTAYMVMDYEAGESLAERFKENSATEDELRAILSPILAALEILHQAEYWHRNIKPENIYLREKDNSPVLMGLGMNHYYMSHRGITSILVPGYTPFEQYQYKGNDGPWTDIYAFGAVLYWMIGGTTPVESTQRVDAILYNQSDPLTPAVEVGRGRYSEELLETIDWTLETRETERPQTVEEWAEEIQRQDSTPKSTLFHLFKRAAVGIVAVIIVGGLIGGAYFFYTKSKEQPVSENTATTLKEADKKQVAFFTPPMDTAQEAKEPVAEELPSPPVKTPPEVKNVPPLAEPPPAETAPINTPLPETVPVEQPPQVEPAQFIQDYYAAISNQQHDKTWLMLSHHFKDQFHCCNADGSYKEDAYLRWWKTIRQVDVLNVNVQEQHDNTAIVKVSLRYFKRKGRVVDNSHTFKLVKDASNNWLIDESK
ncbi:MAG: hypothetical protein DRQ49_07915 [Gammaproteobacteria bacterium]|nr:MAG: hypothetical protein DRQ49_07915 [Gammaproteobacteria bacterium]RKZ45213.1 MAG: hypothetical protein DRQ41_00800 [Gammaproteobacteria bacterium]